MKKEEMVTFKRNVVFFFFLRTAKKPRKPRPTKVKEKGKGKEGIQTKSKNTRILVQCTRIYGFSVSLFWSGCCFFVLLWMKWKDEPNRFKAEYIMWPVHCGPVNARLKLLRLRSYLPDTVMFYFLVLYWTFFGLETRNSFVVFFYSSRVSECACISNT